MSSDKRIIKLFSYAAKWPLFIASLFIPRSSKIWVFGSWFGHRYSDNSQYVFDYVSEHETNVRAVWLSHNPEIVQTVRGFGREAYLANSAMGYWLGCRAGLTFVTCGSRDVNSIGIFRSKVIQLWHGTPLKKIKHDDKLNENKALSIGSRVLKKIRQLVFPFMDERCNIVISPSPLVTERLETAFRLEPENIPVTGYPRGDVILAPVTLSQLRSAISLPESVSKVLLYAPTHRGEGKGTYDVFETLDIDRLEFLLKENDAVLLLKMHYYHKNSPKLANLDKTSSRVRWLNEDECSDINRLLPFIDILITDYSSVYFDYLLLNRPIVFTPFDLDDYIAKDRELYEEYEDATPGVKCSTWSETIDKLSCILHGEDAFEPQRVAANVKYNTYIDLENSKRVVNEAKKLLS